MKLKEDAGYDLMADKDKEKLMKNINAMVKMLDKEEEEARKKAGHDSMTETEKAKFDRKRFEKLMKKHFDKELLKVKKLAY